MKAVFYIAEPLDWASLISDEPWALLPVANRPILDYWIETCSEAGIDHMQIILGDGAEFVEAFAANGFRWGVKIQYSFARAGESPLDYLKATRSLWTEGLLFIGAPFFLRRRQAFNPSELSALSPCVHSVDEKIVFLYGRSPDDIKTLLEGEAPSSRGLEEIHIQPYVMDSVASYFELNMKMVAGEFSRYLTAGFQNDDSSLVGYNVLTPPSAHLVAPVIVGNDCRLGTMTTIGPRAVIGNHVIIDSSTRLANCLILDDTYIGRNLEIENKIVSGNRLISAEDGTTIEIDDSWVVAQTRPAMRTADLIRYTVLWFLGLGLAAVQLLPFLLLYPAVRLSGVGAFSRELFHDPHTGYILLPVFTKQKNIKSLVYRLFRAATLDRFPLLLMALRGKLFVCGQPPMRHPQDDELIRQIPQYYPAVFSYGDYASENDRLVDALWYAHIRSLFEDIKILLKSLLYRFFRVGSR